MLSGCFDLLIFLETENIKSLAGGIMIKPQTPAAASLPPPGREKLDVDELELTNPTTTPTSPQPVLVHLEHLDHVSRLEDDWII